MKIPATSFGAVHARGPAEEPADDRPGNAQQDGDDHAAPVPPRHEELGDHADDQPENDPAQNAKHRASFASGVAFRCHGRPHRRTTLHEPCRR